MVTSSQSAASCIPNTVPTKSSIRNTPLTVESLSDERSGLFWLQFQIRRPYSLNPTCSSRPPTAAGLVVWSVVAVSQLPVSHPRRRCQSMLNQHAGLERKTSISDRVTCLRSHASAPHLAPASSQKLPHHGARSVMHSIWKRPTGRNCGCPNMARCARDSLIHGSLGKLRRSGCVIRGRKSCMRCQIPETRWAGGVS